MRQVAAKVWNNRRKWVGNLLPALFFLPPVILGILWMHKNNAIFGYGLWMIGLGTLLGWVGLNLFGLFANGFMKRQIRRELMAKDVSFDDPHFFVGFATPRFINMLDAHEDVGYLFLRESYIEFIGESNQVKIPRSEVHSVRFRPNIHSWVGLGRWICVEGERKGKRFRLSVEAREKDFLMLNLFASGNVRRVIAAWLAKRYSPSL